MSSSQKYSLKSCIRIRAAGYAVRSGGDLHGTVRLEAICSRQSFQAVQIRVPPVLPTPLSSSLLSFLSLPSSTSTGQSLSLPSQSLPLPGQSTAGTGTSVPRFGYLTMSQTRGVVPLLESDPAAALCPVVGIWTRCSLAPQQQQQQAEADACGSYLRDPFVCGACLRFMLAERVKERVFISGDTFLLVSHSLTHSLTHSLSLAAVIHDSSPRA